MIHPRRRLDDERRAGSNRRDLWSDRKKEVGLRSGGGRAWIGGMESGPDTGKALSQGDSGPRISLLGGFQLETGVLEYQVDGEPPVTVKAGEVLFIPAEAIRTVRNIGSGNAAELATYVAEKGKPLVVPAK